MFIFFTSLDTLARIPPTLHIWLITVLADDFHIPSALYSFSNNVYGTHKCFTAGICSKQVLLWQYVWFTFICKGYHILWRHIQYIVSLLPFLFMDFLPLANHIDKPLVEVQCKVHLTWFCIQLDFPITQSVNQAIPGKFQEARWSNISKTKVVCLC